MIATAEHQPSSVPNSPSTGRLCDECRQQLGWAKRELGAFQKACEEIFDAEAAAQAAECWVNLAETFNPSASGDFKHWRQISIMAASQMATSHGLRRVQELP